MDRDKMITRIAKVLFSWFEDDEYTWDEVDDATTNPYRWKAESLVNTLLAPVFEKAEKYKKALEQIERGCSFPEDDVQRAIRDVARKTLFEDPDGN